MQLIVREVFQTSSITPTVFNPTAIQPKSNNKTVSISINHIIIYLYKHNQLHFHFVQCILLNVENERGQRLAPCAWISR